MDQTELEMAQRRIAQGRRLVAEQREKVARLKAPIVMRLKKSRIYSRIRWLLLKSTSRHFSPKAPHGIKAPPRNPDRR